MARSKKAQAAIDDALSLDSDIGTVGLGIDIVEIPRMRRILERTPSFARRCFSEAECDYCFSTMDPAKGFAARFAAKEAVVKALGCGFSEGIGVRDIEVARNSRGRPQAVLHGRAAEVAAELGIDEIALSMSHTENDAVACAMALTADAMPSNRKKETPAEEMARLFKETRGMLDGIGDGKE